MADPHPEEDAAVWRRSRGIRRVGQVPRDDRLLPHPSRGGARGYPIVLRRIMMADAQAGRPVITSMVRSIRRWLKERHLPYRMTGNKSRRSLYGIHLLLLVMYKMIWPQATYLECSAFIANNSPDGRIFTEWAVGDALRKLGFTRKASSTTAYQAYTPRNVLRRNLFWSRPLPLGIHGVRRCRINDVDEFGIHLNAANRKYGSAPNGLRVRKPGHYDRGTFKCTVIMGIEAGDAAIPDGQPGSLSNPRRWARIRNIAGTTAEAYSNFVRTMLGAYTPVQPGGQRVVIHDNYSSHKSPLVTETIRQMGHKVVCRPPYRPQDGPVEFAINQVMTQLTLRWGEVEDLSSMIRVLQDIIDNGLKGMDDLFKKCGYRHN